MELDASSSTPERPPRSRTVWIVLGVVVALALAGLLIWGVLWASRAYPAELEAMRDVFIIALALESCLFGIALMVMLIMLIRLANMLQFEIKPILEQTNEAIGTVRGTTRFVSHNVVQPVVEASVFAAGIRRGFQALFGNPRRNLPD